MSASAAVRATVPRPRPAAIPEDEWGRAAAMVQGAQRILVCAHHKPDGDTIGSLLGLGHSLAQAGKEVTLTCADTPDATLATLPGAEGILTRIPAIADGRDRWDLVVTVDVSSLDRLGALYEDQRMLFEALPILNIDHHATNPHFGAANLVDPQAASATEVVTLLLQRLGIPLTVPVATCLLAGMMTDTLSFQTESTTGQTLRVAATLVEAGAPLAPLAVQLFRQRSVGNALIWKQALGTLQFAAGGRIAWVEVTPEMFEAAGAGADSAGLSNFALSVAGVEVGMAIEQERDGNVYVSLRSPTVDVAAVAARFGGGGHQRAAGCQFPPAAGVAGARAQLLPILEDALTPRPPLPPGAGE